MEVKRRQQIGDKAALLLGSLLLTLAIVEAGFRVLGIEAQYVPERRDELIPLDGQPAQPLPHGWLQMPSTEAPTLPTLAATSAKATA